MVLKRAAAVSGLLQDDPMIRSRASMHRKANSLLAQV